MRRVAAVLLFALSSACQPPVPPEASLTYRTRWHTADRPRPSTTAAVVFYPGDASRLDELEAKFLGKLIFHGPGSIKEAMYSRKAAEVAAESGGTHVVLVGEEDTETTVGVRSGTSATSCWSATCITTSTPPSVMTETRKTRVFAVYAVSPDRWSELPFSLSPALRNPYR